MSCLNIDRIHNCGRCEFVLKDDNVLMMTSVLDITKSVTNVLWMNKFTNLRYNRNLDYQITFSCTGLINVFTEDSNTKLHYDVAIEIYYTMLERWYNISHYSLNTDLNDKLLEIIPTTNKLMNINVIRQKSIKLVKYLEYSIEKDKENEIANRHIISLSDTNSIAKFDSTIILSILNTIVEYTNNVLNDCIYFVDLNTCYTDNKGNVAFTDDVKVCRSNVKVIKELYSIYLNTWCKTNFMKCNEIVKIKRSINSVNRAKDLRQLADISANLISEIGK